MVREKQHRLPDELYRGIQVVSFTGCIRNRDSFFTTRDRFTIFEEMLLNSLKRFEALAELHLFMPDHAHLLLRGASETADVLRSMRSFKQATGFWLSRNHSAVHWQKDFYDHILRKNEEIKTQILYILNNPVRKGFVQNWKNYPFKGSTIYKLEECDSV